MAQFKAQPGVKYKNNATGQVVSYNENDLKSPAIGFLSDQYTEYKEPVSPAFNNNASQVQYNADGTRISSNDPVASYYEQHKPMTDEEWNTKQEEIKSQTNREIQESIDAINATYVPIYAQAAREAEGRLGSTANINALAGQRGTPSGAATTEKTTQYNSEIKSSIDARKQNEINLIRNQYAKDERDELRYQENLRREDMDKYLTYLQTANDRKIEKSKAKMSDYISSYIDWDYLSPEEQNEYADLFGYDSLEMAQRSYEAKINQAILESETAQTENVLSTAKSIVEIAKLENEAYGNDPGYTDDIKEYQYAVQNGYQGSFKDWQKGEENPLDQYEQELKLAKLMKDLAEEDDPYEAEKKQLELEKLRTDIWKAKNPEEKEPTQAQFSAASYADRMNNSSKVIEEFEQKVLEDNAFTEWLQGKLPNWIKSEDYQLIEQSQRDFVNAKLRQESGAAIAPSEFESAKKQYFPQPGDSQKVIDQKRRNRQTVIDGMIRQAGNAYQGQPNISTPEEVFGDSMAGDSELDEIFN